mmetsp:Transcript_59017/g.106044  ORF Transcript_59017/g.106044 Transcript_59017/m.106044 type:complete len:225 (-) Transcript_59017:118-792(-)
MHGNSALDSPSDSLLYHWEPSTGRWPSGPWSASNRTSSHVSTRQCCGICCAHGNDQSLYEQALGANEDVDAHGFRELHQFLHSLRHDLADHGSHRGRRCDGNHVAGPHRDIRQHRPDLRLGLPRRYGLHWGGGGQGDSGLRAAAVLAHRLCLEGGFCSFPDTGGWEAAGAACSSHDPHRRRADRRRSGSSMALVHPASGHGGGAGPRQEAGQPLVGHNGPRRGG